MQDALQVSVIVPTFNRARLILRALNSVLDQTEPPREIIVVDDGSTDNTAEVLEPYSDKVIYVRQAQKGVSQARNAGLEISTAPLVAFLDSDDYWQPWKLAMQREAFRVCPAVVLVGTGRIEIDDAGQPIQQDRGHSYSAYRHLAEISPFTQTHEISVLSGQNTVQSTLRVGDLSSAMFMGNLFITSSTVFRREALQGNERFDAAMQDAGEDYDFFWRLAQNGPCGLLEAPAIFFRRGAGDHLHKARRRMALSNLRTLEKFTSTHPDGPKLPEHLIKRRLRESYTWAGLACFEEEFPRESRRHLYKALAAGVLNPRVVAYLLLSWAPSGFRVAAQSIYHLSKGLIRSIAQRAKS